MRTFAFLFAALSFVGASAASEASPSVGDLLREADEVRTSDLARFEALLDDLGARTESATAIERERIRLLQAHRLITRGRSEEAVAILRDVVAEPAGMTNRFLAGSMLANTHAITRRFEAALHALDAMLAGQGDVEDKDILHRGLLVAAIVYNQVGEFSLGLHYAERVLHDNPLGRSRCAAGNLVLEARNGLKERVGIATAMESVQVCEAEREPILAGFSRTYVAEMLAEEGKLENAIELLESYLSVVEKTGYPLLVGQYHAMLAEYRMKLGQVEAAERHARYAISNTASLASALPLVVAYRTLYQIAEHRHDPELALATYKLYAQADKAHFNDVKSREMAYQVVRHQTQQQAQQIELLNQKNTVLELQQRVAEQRAQNTGLIAVLLTMLLASIGFWAYKTKRLQVRLRRMAELDMLTGISNRHHFTQKAEQSLAQCARAGEDAVLVMFDLDHFKLVNDRFGHAAGDCALRLVAAACTPGCRPVDCIGRLGGEEFGILLPGCDLDTGKRLAEDCIERFARIQTADCGHVFQITASFGVTSSTVSGYDLTRMLSHADRALYRAKRSGRNRICTYDTGLDAVALTLATGRVHGAPAEDDEPGRDRGRRLGAAVG
ncbi:GGDEF domain-containing protein [Luteimonas sp. RD2P54]|uniref:diguanylate cyclase n=1 Tax=Luteimonas endophytica TaxID=3042023 RepID=A0ABT6JAR1_9GAMM|nr:GGDEF domain-containing protein [Luteimonas endophytica]MDH5823921.1 GGDEF domain-containing protein [Luteimonas endophytica]